MTYPTYYDTMAYIISLIDEERVHVSWQESQCGVWGRGIYTKSPSLSVSRSTSTN